MKQVVTVGEFLRYVDDSYVNPKALNSYVNESWIPYSTQEFIKEVKLLALGLKKLGIKKGSIVGLMAPGSAKWTIVDLAIMAAGLVTLPLFSNLSEDNFTFEMNQAKPKTVFLGGDAAWERYEHDKQLFENVIDLDNNPSRVGSVKYDELLALGAQLDAEQPHFYEELLNSIKPSDLATIVYTSGSTGFPIAAEHTHSTLFSITNTDIFNLDPKKDRYLSILPLAHIYARTLNVILIGWGISTYYFNDLKNLGIACKQIHPTAMAMVPRILEKVYAKMALNVHSASFLKRTIGQFAFDFANQEKETLWKHLFHPLAESLVYSKLREAVGGSLRVIISGGARLDPHLNHFFQDIGVPIYEGWGLTEGCPLTVNRIGKNKIGTIGCALDQTFVKLSENNEILVKAPNIMRGYYKNEEATAHALDNEGWLHTGDKGIMDEDGYITIIGRLKEIFKTSTGEMVAPLQIEQSLCKAPFIEMSLVIAEKRKFVSCLLVPNFDILKALKQSQHVEQLSNEEFLHSDYIKNEMDKLLASVNEHLNYWEQIRDYRFITDELSTTRGEMTPTMKIVRGVIEKKYKNLIDSMYGEVAT